MGMMLRRYHERAEAKASAPPRPAFLSIEEHERLMREQESKYADALNAAGGTSGGDPSPSAEEFEKAFDEQRKEFEDAIQSAGATVEALKAEVTSLLDQKRELGAALDAANDRAEKAKAENSRLAAELELLKTAHAKELEELTAPQSPAAVDTPPAVEAAPSDADKKGRGGKK